MPAHVLMHVVASVSTFGCIPETPLDPLWTARVQNTHHIRGVYDQRRAVAGAAEDSKVNAMEDDTCADVAVDEKRVQCTKSEYAIDEKTQGLCRVGHPYWVEWWLKISQRPSVHRTAKGHQKELPWVGGNAGPANAE